MSSSEQISAAARECASDDELKKHADNLMLSKLITATHIEIGHLVGEECPHCGTKEGVAKRRLNTAYVNDESNWLVSCKSCFDEAVEYYSDLWDAYYHG